MGIGCCPSETPRVPSTYSASEDSWPQVFARCAQADEKNGVSVGATSITWYALLSAFTLRRNSFRHCNRMKVEVGKARPQNCSRLSFPSIAPGAAATHGSTCHLPKDWEVCLRVDYNGTRRRAERSGEIDSLEIHSDDDVHIAKFRRFGGRNAPSLAKSDV